MAYWRTGLCSCVAEPGGVQACCLGFCCTEVLYGLNVEKLERPGECALGGSCLGGGLLWAVLAWTSGTCCIAQCAARQATRAKFGIPGNPGCDCLISACCCCCAVIQEYNQLHGEEPAVGAGVVSVANRMGR